MPTICAQQPSSSASNQAPAGNDDLSRLKQLLVDTLNKLAHDQAELKALKDLSGQQDIETAAAKRAIAIAQSETASLMKAIEADKIALEAMQRAFDAETKAAAAYEHRAISAETRVDQLQGQVSSANKRTGIVAILAVLSRFLKF